MLPVPRPKHRPRPPRPKAETRSRDHARHRARVILMTPAPRRTARPIPSANRTPAPTAYVAAARTTSTRAACLRPVPTGRRCIPRRRPRSPCAGRAADRPAASGPDRPVRGRMAPPSARRGRGPPSVATHLVFIAPRLPARATVPPPQVAAGRGPANSAAAAMVSPPCCVDSLPAAVGPTLQRGRTFAVALLDPAFGLLVQRTRGRRRAAEFERVVEAASRGT